MKLFHRTGLGAVCLIVGTTLVVVVPGLRSLAQEQVKKLTAAPTCKPLALPDDTCKYAFVVSQEGFIFRIMFVPVRDDDITPRAAALMQQRKESFAIVLSEDPRYKSLAVHYAQQDADDDK